MTREWVYMAERNSIKMKHDATRFLFAYWSNLRADRAAPHRREIEPAEIGRVLSNTFILEAEIDGSYNYRLAGTHICAAFGRELKGADWLVGWPGRDREALATLMRSTVSDGAGALLGFDGRNARQQRVPFESLLLPLAYDGPQYRRILGLTVPLDNPYWLGALPVTETALTSLSPIWPSGRDNASSPETADRPATEQRMPLRRMGHLALYDGGQP